MNPLSVVRSRTGRRSIGAADLESLEGSRPLVSVVVPAYNEAAILEQNLTALCEHLRGLEQDYRWEIVFINDGSSDETGSLAERFASVEPNVRVIHHAGNGGLGRAIQTAFDECRGDYLVVLDLDLSYSPDHIEKLLTRIREAHAQVVVASPYMKGGQVSNVPWLRRMLSVWANRFLSLTAKGSLTTLTGMVRAYDGRFVRSMDLSASGMEVNPEIIFKALLLKGRVEEVPAHLDWRLQNAVGKTRRSSMKLARQMAKVLLAGYLFRPVVFFILPGLLLLLCSLYVNAWVVTHLINEYGRLSADLSILHRFSYAGEAAFKLAPHTFVAGIGSLTIAIQLLSLGIVALQNQRYFELMFHLGSSIYGSVKDNASTAVRRVGAGA